MKKGYGVPMTYLGADIGKFHFSHVRKPACFILYQGGNEYYLYKPEQEKMEAFWKDYSMPLSYRYRPDLDISERLDDIEILTIIKTLLGSYSGLSN